MGELADEPELILTGGLGGVLGYEIHVHDLAQRIEQARRVRRNEGGLPLGRGSGGGCTHVRPRVRASPGLRRGGRLAFHVMTDCRQHALADKIVVDVAIEPLELGSDVLIEELQDDEAYLDIHVYPGACILDGVAQGLRTEGIMLRLDLVDIEQGRDTPFERIQWLLAARADLADHVGDRERFFEILLLDQIHVLARDVREAAGTDAAFETLDDGLDGFFEYAPELGLDAGALDPYLAHRLEVRAPTQVVFGAVGELEQRVVELVHDHGQGIDEGRRGELSAVIDER